MMLKLIWAFSLVSSSMIFAFFASHDTFYSILYLSLFIISFAAMRVAIRVKYCSLLGSWTFRVL